MPKQAYYAARAIDERLQAQAATNPRAAAAHLELSARYEALASDPSLDLATIEAAPSTPSASEPALDMPADPPLAAQLSTAWNPTD